MWDQQYEQIYSHIINIYDKQQQPPTNKGNIYLSSVDGLDNADLLKILEIDCVLSIVDKLTHYTYRVKDKLRKSKIKHSKWIDLEDYNQENIYPHLDEAHSYIKSMLPEHNILIHCQMDMSRSLSIVIAYLMKEYGEDYQHAPIYAKNKRSIVEPKAGFDKQVRKFQRYERKHHPHLFHRHK